MSYRSFTQRVQQTHSISQQGQCVGKPHTRG